MKIEISRAQAASAGLSLNVPGEYNLDNAWLAIQSLCALGFDEAALIQTAKNLSAPLGRMQQVMLENPNTLQQEIVPLPQVFVDYAHTPDGLQHALLALKPIVTKSGGQLWCVFGCGGDRDASKRPLMGNVAHAFTDVW